ncbi:hypothetical protein THAOC_34629 [Thalassiosira oceanica]|uniref:Leishmanolysin-like peptidase n=1 Tax=Thalassiosira oceanica TaxID=159749 RepID=K0RJ70_THAOC|nr:hypothetical protein THAOC_34629 [Thalassiosira oceanica]|mmetsp:Transcript_14982/g.33823  ORF Transcript_14982/g.33823 Transcript_14982/m.33823 type:complete len:1168 (+) Transcript_14982:63-3566(+)|eukprot:EJK46692.1 hypothetical protein THAOC_34629 [Thalassiosira oceanica]
MVVSGTVPSLLLLACVSSSSSSQTIERLPQHRISSPNRDVDYPDNHPLARHLKGELLSPRGGDAIPASMIDNSPWRRDGSSDGTIRHDQTMRGRPNPLPEVTQPRNNTTSRGNDQDETPELIQEGNLEEGADGLLFWTISGRALASNTTSSNDDNYRGEALLMNMDQIQNENGNIAANPQMKVFVEEDGESILDEQVETEEETESKYKSIRIRAILTDDPTSGSRYLTANQRRILMEDIINPALFAWSKALFLIPVGSGQRRRDRGENDSLVVDRLVVDRSQLYDGVSCGPGLDSGMPSVRVPEKHLTDGVADADHVVYISLAFLDHPAEQVVSPNNHAWWSTSSLSRLDENAFNKSLDESLSQTEFPSAAPSIQPSMMPSEVEPLVESRPICPGSYLASATYCSTDQFDRPVASMLSLCIGDVHNFFYNQEVMKQSVVTIMHEIGHVLGFNAQSMAFFRDPATGMPLTVRNSRGDVPDSKVECTGIAPRVVSHIPLPSEDIMVFRRMRGLRVAMIVTPTVQRVVRNMFGCQSLLGAELQSGEGQLFATSEEQLLNPTPGDCIGDHWSRRLFKNELMNPIVTDAPYSLHISSLTLAFLADSGWYRINPKRVSPAALWGRNAGCGFVENKCITSRGRVSAANSAFFCNNFVEVPEKTEEEEEVPQLKGSTTSRKKAKIGEEKPEIHGCSLDLSSKAVCSFKKYDSYIPSEFNYFGSFASYFIGGTPHYGGSDATLDFCPVFEDIPNAGCGDEYAQSVVGVKANLEIFGHRARCVVGNVGRRRTALCLPIACVIQDQRLMVKVDGYWKHCSYAGQIISVWWNPNDYIVCPDPARTCPSFFCPDDCLENGGICDYEVGKCMCQSSEVASSASNVTSSLVMSSGLEPCDGSADLDGEMQMVQRIEMDVALPEYYVENTTLLVDDERNFDEKINRMFAQLNSGEVVGLVASFIMVALFSYIIWSQALRIYKRRLVVVQSLAKVRSSVGSLSGLLPCSPDSLDDGDGGGTGPGRPRRPRYPRNSQKDKMVATLLVQMRTESTEAQHERQRRLELGGMSLSLSEEEDSADRTAGLSPSQTVVDLSIAPEGFVGNGNVVNRSELPFLPDGGRVLSIVGHRLIEDEAHDDARSSVTASTHVTNGTTGDLDFTSPLYRDADDGASAASTLRLRRQID